LRSHSTKKVICHHFAHPHPVTVSQFTAPHSSLLISHARNSTILSTSQFFTIHTIPNSSSLILLDKSSLCRFIGQNKRESQKKKKLDNSEYVTLSASQKYGYFRLAEIQIGTVSETTRTAGRYDDFHFPLFPPIIISPCG